MAIGKVKAGGWSENQKLTSEQITSLDNNISKALDRTSSDNLDGYITVTATGAMNFVSGSDLVVHDSANVNLHVGSSSNIKITGTGTLTTQSGGRIVLGDNDYPTFSSTRSVVKLVSFIGKCDCVDFYNDWEVNNAYAAYQSLDNNAYLLMCLNDYLINGATLSNIRLTYRVGESHSAIPANISWMRIIRIDSTGSMPSTWLKASAIVDGIVRLDNPASGAAWYSSGSAKTFDYVTDQYNIIDLENYVYYFDFGDEYGTNAWVTTGNILHSLKLTMTNISDMRF